MVFRSFLFIDVDREAIPLNNIAVGLTQRFAHRVMPSVLSICASQAVYYAVQLSRAECPGDCLCCFLSIIWMKKSLPPAINRFFEGSPIIFKQSLREMSWFSGRRR